MLGNSGSLSYNVEGSRICDKIFPLLFGTNDFNAEDAEVHAKDAKVILCAPLRTPLRLLRLNPVVIGVAAPPRWASVVISRPVLSWGCIFQIDK